MTLSFFSYNYVWGHFYLPWWEFRPRKRIFSSPPSSLQTSSRRLYPHPSSSDTPPSSILKSKPTPPPRHLLGRLLPFPRLRTETKNIKYPKRPPSYSWSFLYYEAQNDYTTNSETILLCNRCACNWKINSQTIYVCNWPVHRKYLMKALNYTKEFLSESPV